MSELPCFSSQGSQYEHHQIMQDQENIPSSPPKSRSPKVARTRSLGPKKPPTVTPKRFTKFFTPRDSLSSRGGRQSKAGQQLRDITKNGANRRRHTRSLKDDFLAVNEDDSSSRPTKRRKVSFDLASSPPQSSPLKHVQAAAEIHVFEDEPASPVMSDEDALSSLLEECQPFPQPLTRLQQYGSAQRVLQRSFGGYNATNRGWRGTDHCVDWRAETANFVSTPTDIHAFRGTALPFCTTSCNTNSLIAVGEEEGSIRLIDTAASSSFSKAHVEFRPHHNAIMDIAFSSDDLLLATAGGDQTARVVDMHTQQTMCILSGHDSSVKQVRFQPNDDNIITTSSRDGTVQVWDLRCSERGSMQSLRPGQRRGLNEDGVEEPSIRYARDVVQVGPAHRSASTQHSEDAKVSITAIQHFPGRKHLLLTASELNASINLWDLRSAGRRNAVPLVTSRLPQSHAKTRNFGISSMVLSGDGARLYTLCKDATVYAYSTNHFMMGCAPALPSSSTRRASAKESKTGIGPLYAFSHPSLRTGSFYLKAALRKAHGEKSEMLAVSSTDNCTILFPTDERHLHRPEPASDLDMEQDDELPSITPRSFRRSQTPFGRLAEKDSLPRYEQGTALVRGHNKEVTSLSWTHDGDLVTVCDDFTVRCWRENAAKAREIRSCGEGGGQRWGHGWADVDAEFDEDDC